MNATILHASCISVDGRGLLILGPSGSGKSSLALRLIALGARLVADDRTEVVAIDNRLIARCPPAIRGLVEARGVGLLRAEASGEVPVVLVADLGRTEEQRLPPYRRITLMGCELDLVLHPRNDHFPEALLLYLRNGRQA
ncbi:HPr kinase/phosphorylase [Tabrizicola sp. YIM 78059]|uniref:HPr kinase/phosphorylase n=1 Tax=Tabrizicola sp. YIM 78059 TaxID=2529861 RepID=UPI0010AA5BEC|nr:HPr kinase/phosphatase C-terminal domain-containing protein [Tabrizicola sp. YIM 78059]